MNENEKSNILELYVSRLKNIKDPTILELGVNKGHSTRNFLDHINKFGGKLFSIDIKKAPKLLDEDKTKWNFLRSNDLDIENILNNFPALKSGIDVLFIDSYHDETHVKKTLEKWFIYVKKNGYIYFDDTESAVYRKNKNLFLSINNDAINKLIYNIYCNNIDQLEYIKYFRKSGLSEFKKLSDLGNKLILTNKVWHYNFIFSKIYLILKKIIYKLKSKDKIKY